MKKNSENDTKKPLHMKSSFILRQKETFHCIQN